MPIAIVGTRYSDSYDLVHAAFAIPVGLVLGAGAIAVARSASRRASVRLDGGQQRGAARIGRALGVAGIAIAASALISVSVYGLLTYLGER